MGAPAVLVSTYPTRAAAARAARAAVSGRLAACVNIARVRSVYEWKGRLEDGPEYVALFKTTRAGLRRLREQVAESHPYEVPEIAELPLSSVNAPYMRWVAGAVSRGRRT